MSKSGAKKAEPRPGPRPGAGPAAAGRRKARLNLRAALILGAAVVVAVPAYFGIRAVQDSLASKGLMREVRKNLDAAPPKPDLALKFLDRYLDVKPGDVGAMDLRAKLLTESARSEGEVAAAVQANDFVLRRDPDGPGRQETRRRLVELYLRLFQMDRGKAGTAEATARDLIARDAKAGTPDARDHRLLARALLDESATGVTTAMPRAIAEFEAASRLDPADVAGAATLAHLYVKERKDRHRADAVLDALLVAAPGPAARLARYRHYAQFGPSEKARLELEAAVKEAPADIPVRLAAAEDALDRNEPAAAREHLAAIPAAHRDDIQVRFLRGVLELREHHTDDAISNWRQGLRLTGGTSKDLTYRLAWVLLQQGRAEDARPLMDQFRRLTGGTKPAPEYRYLEALRDLRANEPAKALATMEEIKATINKRMRGALYVTMGQCYEATRDEPRALEAYRSAAAAQPRAPEPYLNSARLLAGMRGPEAAADELRHALAQAPDDPGLLLGLARVLLRQRNYPELKDVLDRAARVAPTAPGLAMLRADYLAGTERLGEAVALMAEAARKGDRTDATLWVSYANGLLRQGNAAAAMKALEEGSAADAAGDHAPLRVARARLLQQGGRGVQARAVLARDLNQLPPAERPQALRALAELLTMQGDRPVAMATLRQWSALAPDDPQPALTMLDMALAPPGDEASARDAVKALKAIRQGEGAYGYIGQAFEALRDTSGVDKQANLDEAERLVKKILEVAPQLPQGHLMRSLMLEERARDPVLAKRDRDRRLDDAVLAYQKALDNGGTAAIPRLIELLTRRNRFAELAILRKRVAADRSFDLISANAAIKNGLPDEAERIAARVVEADPDGLDARVLQASILKRLGKPDDAEEALREFAKARPGEPGPWLQLLVFQVGRNRREAAGATISQFIRNVKGERPEFLHAQAYKIAGDLKKAGELFQESLKKWPEDPAVARGAADFYADVTGNLDKAEAILRKAIKADPTAGWATRKLALILSGRPKDAKAWEEAARLVDAPADRGVADLPEDRLTRAVVLSRSPDPVISARAIPILRSLKDDLKPDSPVGKAARSALTRYFLMADRPDEAWKLANASQSQAEDVTPDDVALYADALLRTKKLDEAEAQVARLAELEPDGLRAEVLKARVLAARGKAHEAAAALEAAFREREKAPNALAAAGTILATLMDLGYLEAAERVANRETELRPGDAWMLARVLARRERTKDALDACRKAITNGGSRIAVQIALSLAVVPGASAETLQGADEVVDEALKREPAATRADLLIQRAHIRHLQGNFRDELKIYDEMSAAFPAEHGYLNNWAWTLSESLDKPAQGLELIRKAIDRSGRYPIYLDTEGVIQSRLGHHAEAVKLLEESAPNLAGGLGYLHLARAYHLAGQDPRAREALERARTAGLKPASMEDADRRDLEELTAALAPKGAATAPAPAPAPAPPGARPPAAGPKT